MTNDLTSKLLQSYRTKRTAVTDMPVAGNDLRQAYLQAAAVFHCFYPDTLLPLNPVVMDIAAESKSKVRLPGARTVLFDDITYSPGRSAEGIFTLNTEIRKEVLKKFISREAILAAVRQNRGQPETSLQTMWVSYLQSGVLPDAGQLSYNQLTDLCQIISWLEGIDQTIPDKNTIELLLRQKSVLSNFEHLVTSNFTGRETELTVLRRHISGLKGKSKSKGFLEVITDWFSTAEPRPILSVFGPGGIGKSALSGKLLWDNVQSSVDHRVPFAYMAFDQGILRIESPFTILVEAAVQFELQFPEYITAIETFNNAVRIYREKRDDFIKRKNSSDSRNIKLQQSVEEELKLYDSFAELLNVLSSYYTEDTMANRNVLMVFDTFEEVEYRDYESLNRFWQMLSHLIQICPFLRIIISGRTSITRLGVDPNLLTELALTGLSSTDGSLLLQRLGVDKEIADVVAKQVGGNPLSLRLAANLILSDKSEAGSGGIKNLDTRKWLFFQVNEQVIQGQLYRRILDHIHDENVKKLAHPGMVLRSVTPAIILHVLAPQCGIAIHTLEEANALFLELKKEQALVENGYQGDLVYRPELRQTMIKLLQQDKYNEVRELRRSAIRYYESKDDLASRAEELYHRLALDEDDFITLDTRWTQGIETSVASNLGEYSDRIKVWLGSRMELELPREVFEKADVADWERNISRKVKKAITDNNWMHALQLLSERDKRSHNSPLHALETKVNMLMENYTEAKAVLKKGIEQLSAGGNRGRLAELFWLLSQVELLEMNYLAADDALQQAGNAVVNAGSPLAYMHVLCHRIILRQQQTIAFTPSAADLRAQLNKTCERVTGTNAYAMKFVLPLALNLLNTEFPKTVERLSEFVSSTYEISPDTLTGENLQGLEEYAETWENDDENYMMQEALV